MPQHSSRRNDIVFDIAIDAFRVRTHMWVSSFNDADSDIVNETKWMSMFGRAIPNARAYELEVGQPSPRRNAERGLRALE